MEAISKADIDWNLNMTIVALARSEEKLHKVFGESLKLPNIHTVVQDITHISLLLTHTKSSGSFFVLQVQAHCGFLAHAPIKIILNNPIDWECFRNKTVLVTGATGRLGMYLVEAISNIKFQLVRL